MWVLPSEALYQKITQSLKSEKHSDRLSRVPHGNIFPNLLTALLINFFLVLIIQILPAINILLISHKKSRKIG